jgi:hypothetical protein
MTKMGLTLNGTSIYPLTESRFFDSYVGVTTPNLVDSGYTGYNTVVFCSDPFMYNPNGFINSSTARELYIPYEASGISITNQATFYASAQALTILAYSKDTIKLTYIT